MRWDWGADVGLSFGLTFFSACVETICQLVPQCACVDSLLLDLHALTPNQFLCVCSDDLFSPPCPQKRGSQKGYIDLTKVKVVEKVLDGAFDKPSFQASLWWGGVGGGRRREGRLTFVVMGVKYSLVGSVRTYFSFHSFSLWTKRGFVAACVPPSFTAYPSLPALQCVLSSQFCLAPISKLCHVKSPTGWPEGSAVYGGGGGAAI